jgi:sucrose-6-phosphate hydrolase SacC (GH32 family)
MRITSCISLASIGVAAAALARPTSAEPVAPPAASPGVYQEALRPLVHFTAKKNWLNDPNGLVYFDGEYHLFFQHNPNGIEWGDMTWGHAVSRDLVHWTQLDNAITPDALGTIYSGSAAVDWTNSSGFGKDGKPPLVAMYTAAGGKSQESKGKPFTQCLAFSNDRGRTWTKFDGNPVIPHIVAENRDPKIIWHAPTKRWILALYEDRTRFSLHSSPDLKTWTKLQSLMMPEGSECPDFFPMPLDGDASKERWVFMAADASYGVGTFDGKTFVPEQGTRQTDFGRNFYAVQSFSDIPKEDGRRIQIAWMRGPRVKGMPFNQQMSFPTEVTLKSTASGPWLFRVPAREIQSLHKESGTVTGTFTASGVMGVDSTLADLKGEAFHIVAQFEVGAATEVGLVVFGEPIVYSVEGRTLNALGEAWFKLEDGKLNLELIVDRGSIETFAQRGQYALAGCFEPRAGSPPVSVLIKGKGATVTLVATPLKSAWESHK